MVRLDFMLAELFFVSHAVEQLSWQDRIPEAKRGASSSLIEDLYFISDFWLFINDHRTTV